MKTVSFLLVTFFLFNSSPGAYSTPPEYQLNNYHEPTRPVKVTLSIPAARTFECAIDNLKPNNGYVVNFYRNDIVFGFYRVRLHDVIWSASNLDANSDFIPSKGPQSSYPNFTVDISADSELYGNFQCSVRLLGVPDNAQNVFDSDRFEIAKERELTPTMKWERIKPKVNVTFEMIPDHSRPSNASNPHPDLIYEAKCTVRFDRPIADYIVRFESLNHYLGQYRVETDPARANWTAAAADLLKSGHEIIELEAESNHPTHQILLKPARSDIFSCKVIIPSSKHPFQYLSNELNPSVKVNVTLVNPNSEANFDKDKYLCVVDIRPDYRSYTLDVINADKSVHFSFGNKTKSGMFLILETDFNPAGKRCRVNYLGKEYISPELK